MMAPGIGEQLKKVMFIYVWHNYDDNDDDYSEIPLVVCDVTVW